MQPQIVLQVEDIRRVNRVIDYPCGEIRVGSEFCEHKIPSLEDLCNCVAAVKKAGKRISIIYPRLSERAMAEVERHLSYLNHNFSSIDVVANDLGIPERIKKANLSHINVYLGRQLISLPTRARPAMAKIMGKENLLSRFAKKQLFYKINLDYSLTRRFLKRWGVCGFDIDYVPAIFPQLYIFARDKTKINIHTANVLVSLTRKCHTARYFRKKPGQCGRLCFENKLKIFDDRIGPLDLYGNTLLDPRPVDPGDWAGLKIKNKSPENTYKFVIGADHLDHTYEVKTIDQTVKLLSKVFL